MSDEKSFDRTPFGKAMLKIDSKLKHRLDEALADLRIWWDRWTPEQRQDFRKWLDDLAAVKEAMPNVCSHVTLRLQFSEPVGEGDTHEFSPPIRAVKFAIEHWERGEHYTPTKLVELCG